MLFVSHRGNLDGPNPAMENTMPYIDAAIQQGFLVEVDVWYVDGHFWLGHDSPDTALSLSWLLDRNEHLLIHCKNRDALSNLIIFSTLNVFWHEQDKYTLTSQGQIWCYPYVPIPAGGIQCEPLLVHHEEIQQLAGGVCSDFIAKLRYEQGLTHTA
jgi:hypothetical protein